MRQVTRSLHPLPFEHLEPKRFEDLVRQLVYDFRQWRQLEATGRAGSDDGFDARGYEITDHEPATDDNDAAIEPAGDSDRLWLIQCKREQRIGPKKLLDHLNAIPAPSLESLHGIIFAACCDFSKQALDSFRDWCRRKGVQECYLWGRAAIEDTLFLPKNDHLLFAYFGVSLQMRRQKVASGIRRTVSLRRRLSRLLPGDPFPGSPIILRDPTDERYPFTGNQGLKDGGFRWQPCYSKGLGPRGLLIVERLHLAYLDPLTGEWDFATSVDYSIPHERENYWYRQQIEDSYEETSTELRSFWWTLPDNNRYHLFVVRRISFEAIIEIDDVEDRITKMPTIFTNFQDGKPPLEGGGQFFLPVGSSLRETTFDDVFHGERHTRIFPEKFRDVAWEQGWFTRHGYSYAAEQKRTHSEPDEEK